MRNFLAFTLAETLIVIGIIGIVSALTLPNLNSSTGEKEKVVKVKKVYQNLTDAFGRSEAVYGPFRDVVAQKKIYSKNFADNTNQFAEVLGERLTEFMKISKNCKSNNKGGCFSNAKGAGYEYLNLSNHTYSFILADGTSVLIVPEAELGGFIMIDIDGPNKGKSTVDRICISIKCSWRFF